MKKAIFAVVLTAAAASASAQDTIREKALQMQAGHAFAETLVQNAVPAGKTGEVSLTYMGPQGWDCHVRIMTGAGFYTTVVEAADTPERACVKAVLSLNKDKVL